MTQGNTLRQPSGAPAPSRALRVLTIDDDKDALLTLTLLLQIEGHQARGAATAAAGWNLVRAFDPDIVLLDIGLPDKSGYELAREFRRWYGTGRPVIIALTAWNQSADKMLCRLAGCDHHVGKPYDPQALLALFAPVIAGLHA